MLRVGHEWKGACSTCMECAAIIGDRATSETARRQCRARLDTHLERKTKAREAWNALVGEGRSRKEKVLIIDFAESKSMPTWNRTPNDMYFVSKPVTHIMGIYDCANWRRPIHQLFLRQDAAGMWKNANGVLSCLYQRLSNDHDPSPPVRILMDNTCSQNKNRYVFAGLQMMCLEGLAPSFECFFLLPGHTKNDLDRLFGRMKNKWRALDCIYTPDQLKGTDTCTIHEPAAIYDFRSLFRDRLKVPGIPDISNIRRFRVTGLGLSTSVSVSGDDDWTPVVDMLSSDRPLIHEVPQVPPCGLSSAKKKGLQLAFKFIPAAARQYWLPFMSMPSDVPSRKRKAPNDQKQKSSKAKKTPTAAAPLTQELSQVPPESAQLLQLSQELTQASQPAGEGPSVARVLDDDFDSDYEEFMPCYVCDRARPPKPRAEADSSYGKSIRWFFCEDCHRWVHHACSRFRMRPNSLAIAEPYCDICHERRTARELEERERQGRKATTKEKGKKKVRDGA